ncbi:hypothetical protein C8A03DRAFT_33430 [Achaetomium macrosporum]|uniref:Heterokaryon incompatibility domain-containing protein n=1 Tax=Achaetomium macrosporum TaxID=79813 RepID=A0AAN7CBY1_9PEZI|nr:hypothetical protein C8A03DRAFT_33430 [Achaetomium macrosporum]
MVSQEEIERGQFNRDLRISIAKYGEWRWDCNRMRPRSGPRSLGPHIDIRGLMSTPILCGVMTDDEIAHTMRTDPAWPSTPRGCRLRVSFTECRAHEDDDHRVTDEWEKENLTWESQTIPSQSMRADLTSVDPCVRLDDNGVGTAFVLSLGLQVEMCSEGRVAQVTLEENAERVRVQVPPSPPEWDYNSFVTLAKAFSVIAVALQRVEFLGLGTGKGQALEEARSAIQDALVLGLAARVSDAELRAAAPVLPFLPLGRLCGGGQHITLERLQEMVSRTMPYYAVAPRGEFHQGKCGCFFPGGKVEAERKSGLTGVKITPRRFYDARRRNEARLDDKIVALSASERVDNYVPLSYPWASYDSEDLEKIIATAHKELKHRYYWVDRWCIDQESREDKEKEVPKMKDYYSNGECTLILPGMAFPIELARLGSDRKVRLYKPELVQQVKQIWENCQWRRRCWTLQEAVMSTKCTFWTGHEEAPFIDCSQLISVLRSSAIGNHYISTPSHLSMEVGCVDKTTLAGMSAVVAGSTEESIFQRGVVRCSSHGTVTDADAHLRPLAVLLDKLRGRDATMELDEYYSLFSMALDKLPAVNYSITTFQLIERMVNSGALGANLLLTSTGRRSDNNRGWLPRRCAQREYSMMGTVINAVRPRISDGAMVVKATLVTIRPGDDDRDHFAAGTDIVMVQPNPGAVGGEVDLHGTVRRKLKKASHYLLLDAADWPPSKFTSGLILLATEEQQSADHRLIDTTVVDDVTQDRFLRNHHLGIGRPVRLL